MSSSSCVLYVGAIPYNWDVEVIKSVVCGSGPVVDVRCMMDNTAKNKGFCFIEYLSPLDALNALTTLSKIKIEGRKKLRIELSKEGLRNNQHITKPTLKLNRTLLPANVILPQEMKAQPENVGDIDNELDLDINLGINDDKSFLRHLKKSIRENNDVRSMVGQMLANGMDLQQIANLITQFNLKNNPDGNVLSQQPSISSLQQQQQHQQHQQHHQLQSHHLSNNIPHTPINASSYLPQPTRTMQSTMAPLQPLDPVSKTLSTIPPGVLIELLAKLKLVLSSPNPNAGTYTEAANILNENPKLAVAAAQALLLMGIVDIDVLQQAQQAHQSQQQQAQQQQHQSHLQQSTQQPLQHIPSNQSPLIDTSANINANSNANNSTSAPSVPYEWMSLPEHTVVKLLQLPRKDADLIFQVLQLSPQQLTALPPNERNMAIQIRSQYF